jgi:hypothetical protein
MSDGAIYAFDVDAIDLLDSLIVEASIEGHALPPIIAKARRFSAHISSTLCGLLPIAASTGRPTRPAGTYGTLVVKVP